MGGEPVSITDKLRQAAIGRPYAKIPWPHRLLHDAIEHIETLTAERDEAVEGRDRYKAALPGAHRKLAQAWNAEGEDMFDWSLTTDAWVLIEEALDPRTGGEALTGQEEG